jgi:hypothetical protein
MSGRGHPGSAHIAKDVMAAVMTAEQGNGESIKQSMRERLQSSNSVTRFVKNGFFVHDSISHPDMFFTSFYYGSFWYQVDIIAKGTVTSEKSGKMGFMFNGFVNLAKGLLPSCGENDLVCISRTHSDVDGTFNQNKHIVKKILYLKTSDVILIEILQTMDGLVKIKMKRNFFDGSDVCVVRDLSKFFNRGKMAMKYLEDIGGWFVADPSKRHAALAMGLHKRLGESSWLRLQEEGIVKDISRMSLTGSFDPWKAYDEASASELQSSLDAFKTALEHKRAIFSDLRGKYADREKQLSFKRIFEYCDQELKNINEYLSKKYKRIRKDMGRVLYVPPGDDTEPSEAPASNKSARLRCCMICGLGTMPNLYTPSISSHPMP